MPRGDVPVTGMYIIGAVRDSDAADTDLNTDLGEWVLILGLPTNVVLLTVTRGEGHHGQMGTPRQASKAAASIHRQRRRVSRRRFVETAIHREQNSTSHLHSLVRV